MHIDVDVLDDALMPAVDYRHPGGLSWEEAEHILGGLLPVQMAGTDALISEVPGTVSWTWWCSALLVSWGGW